MPLSLRARIYRFLLRRLFLGPRLTIEQERARAIENSKMMSKIPAGVSLEPVQVGSLPAAWIRPPGAFPKHAVIYLHGGGYVLGGLPSYKQMCAELARRIGWNLLFPEYRLAPEHPFPAALDDAEFTYRWLLEQGYSPSQVVIGGDSAGGGLTLATLLRLRERGIPLPAAAFCISPWTDLACQSRSHNTKAAVESMLNTETLKAWGATYVGKEDVRNPLISPVWADLTGLPPLLIQVGSDEVLLNDSLTVAENARNANVSVQLKVWNELWHVWHLAIAMAPESAQAMDEIGRFVQSHQKDRKF